MGQGQSRPLGAFSLAHYWLVIAASKAELVIDQLISSIQISLGKL